MELQIKHFLYLWYWLKVNLSLIYVNFSSKIVIDDSDFSIAFNRKKIYIII